MIMIMILISKLIFFHLRLTVDNLIMHLKFSEHSDMKINKYAPLKSHISASNHSKNDIRAIFSLLLV